MATSEQIERAARVPVEPRSIGFAVGDDAALAVTTGAGDDAERARAARYAAREVGDLAAMLGLDAPPRPQQPMDSLGCAVLAALLRTIVHAGDDAARRDIAVMTLGEAQAARRELARRIAERPGEGR
ncbi:hypothetical protein [Actinomadura litoris]|uniref:hypothetical protein n=1 Tax=Actinomadura litoris TaxID=2678616 RepID=UPI001FA7E5EC|nr:hypothetical protein [Actinomadura litoris]